MYTNNDLAPKALAVLRIVSGYAFLLHGTAKATGFPIDQTHYVSSWLSLIGLATVLELIGGVFIILGFLTRPTAFILSGMMAVAYFMVHPSLFPMANGGEPAALFCVIFLYLAAAGGGAWTLERAINGNYPTAKR